MENNSVFTLGCHEKSDNDLLPDLKISFIRLLYFFKEDTDKGEQKKPAVKAGFIFCH